VGPQGNLGPHVFEVPMAQARTAIMAVRPFTYRGQPAVVGDVCVVTPAEAAALVYRADARWPRPDEALGVYARRDLVAPPPGLATPTPARRSRRRDASAPGAAEP